MTRNTRPDKKLSDVQMQEYGSHIRHIENLRAGFLGFLLAAFGYVATKGEDDGWVWLTILLLGFLGLLYTSRVQTTLNVFWLDYKKGLGLTLDPDDEEDVRKAGKSANGLQELAGNLGVQVPTIFVYSCTYAVVIVWAICRVFGISLSLACKCHFPHSGCF